MTTSEHSDPLETPSSETLVKDSVLSRPYRRRVNLSLTRMQADIVRRVFLRLSANPKLMEEFGLGPQPARTAAIYQHTQRRIERRDFLQRRKDHLADAKPEGDIIDLTDGFIDTPFEELNEGDRG